MKRISFMAGVVAMGALQCAKEGRVEPAVFLAFACAALLCLLTLDDRKGPA